MNNLFIPFTKKDEELRMVYGYASTEALDSQGEVVSKTAIEEALPDYMKYANIREMHTPSAVGKAHEATIDGKGLFLGVKVVDDSAWQKVKENVYNGFSIGGKIITKVNDTITKLKLSEISLVDRPANPEAVFSFYKGEDMDEEVGIKKGMYTVAWFAELISELSSMQESTEWEAEYEKDGSTIPTELKDQIRGLIEVFKKLVAEETAELLGDKEEVITLADKVEDIAKAGASISTANKDKLKEILAIVTDLIGEEAKEEEAEKSESADDLSKSFSMAKAENVALKEEITKMQGEITILKSQPEPAKGKLLVIGKGEDTGKIVKQEAVVLDSKGEVNEIASMIKSIHTNPIQK